MEYTCPLSNNRSDCFKYCAWYVNEPERGFVGCAVKLMAGVAFRPTSVVEAEVKDPLECPKDCLHRKGRSCMLGTNHCVRRSQDYYSKMEEKDVGDGRI